MHFILTIYRILFAFFCTAKKPVLRFGRCCAQKCRSLFAFGICQKKNPPFEYSVQRGKRFPCSSGHVAVLNPRFCRKAFYDNGLLFCFLPLRRRVFRRNRHILNWNQFLTKLTGVFVPPNSPPQMGAWTKPGLLFLRQLDLLANFRVLVRFSAPCRTTLACCGLTNP